MNSIFCTAQKFEGHTYKVSTLESGSFKIWVFSWTFKLKYNLNNLNKRGSLFFSYSSNKIRKTQNDHRLSKFEVIFLHFFGVYSTWFLIKKLLELTKSILAGNFNSGLTTVSLTKIINTAADRNWTHLRKEITLKIKVNNKRCCLRLIFLEKNHFQRDTIHFQHWKKWLWKMKELLYLCW